MNKTLKSLLAATLLSCSAIGMASCAHNDHARSGGEILDDAALTTKVKAALLAEKDVNSFDIKVKSYRGNVQLSGFVDSQWQVQKAEAVVDAVDGVDTVTNDLIHKPG